MQVYPKLAPHPTPKALADVCPLSRLYALADRQALQRRDRLASLADGQTKAKGITLEKNKQVGLIFMLSKY